MFRFFSRHRVKFVSFLLLVLPLAMLWHHSKQRGEATVYESTLIRVISPAQHGVANVLNALRLVWSDYIWLVGVQQENRELLRHNEVLTGMAQDREQFKKENRRLKRLLTYKGERPDLVTITARVVAKDVSPYHRVLKIKISAGTEHGIRRYQPVITPSGVVGHIELAVGNYAEVKLAVDAGSRISVNVADREIKGIVAGSGNRNVFSASFEAPDPRRQIRPGDMLVTNGEDERFPKGLVVGYIPDQPPQPEEGILRYVVVPSVSFSTLEEVLVVTSQLERPPDMGRLP